MNRARIAAAVFAAWLIIWAIYLIRPYIKKDLYGEYSSLFNRPLEGKRALITGERLYEFILFCDKAMPAGSSYDIAGLEKEPLDERRAVYYLYPHLKRPDDPDYILVYDLEGFARGGYVPYRRLDQTRRIIKREGP